MPPSFHSLEILLARALNNVNHILLDHPARCQILYGYIIVVSNVM